MRALVAGGLLLAASAVAAETLTWEESVQRAAQANPELRAATASLRAREFDTRAAGAGFRPQVSAGVGYADVSGSASPTYGTTAPYSASISVTQNLFAGFQDQARVDQARANEVAATAALDAARAKVSFDLKSAFAGLRRADDDAKLAADIIHRREENLRLVELRFEGGRENKGSYFLSRAALAQARYDALQAQHAVTVAREQLARVLGMDNARDLTVTGEVPVTAPAAAIDVIPLVAASPELRQAQAAERAAEAGITLARSQLMPSLDLSGTHARLGSSFVPADDRNTVALNLRIPIYSGGRNSAGVDSARAGFAAVTDTRKNLQRDLTARFQQAASTYVEAVAKLGVDEAFLEAAVVRADIARRKYDNGLISFEDWDIIENDLVARQKAVLQSRRNRIVSEAAWEQLQGKGVFQ
jgi:outer membrane protein TolC